MEDLILILVSVSFLAYFLSCFSKRRILFFCGAIFLIFVFLGNVFLLLWHFRQIGHLPLTNTSQTLLCLSALIIGTYLILEYRFHLPRQAGLLASLFSFLGLYSAFYIFKTHPIPLLPALQSRWLAFHVSSCIIAYGFFAIAFIAALIYLLKSQTEATVFLVMHRSICVGFLFLTLGIISGSIWGKSAWGNWWNWDPKETWALITWLIYVGYIHVRLSGNRLEKRLAGIAILGFLSCLFTYLGVNFLLKGLHSYG
jgi:ABC-type transport system involved in cytochrome c biogenesis permease subunit